jgi:hypothetical protein
VRNAKTVTTIARTSVRVAFWAEVGLGVILWTGHGEALVSVHVGVGLALVMGLEVLAVTAARAAVRSWLVILGICWGALVPAFGLAQDHLLRPGGHWLIQVTHLLSGVIAVMLAEAIAARLQKAPALDTRTLGARIGHREVQR